MDWFAGKRFDTWCFDARGYGWPDKRPGTKATIAEGAEDMAAVSEYIGNERGTEHLFVYGISSGALKAAAFAGCRGSW